MSCPEHGAWFCRVAISAALEAHPTALDTLPGPGREQSRLICGRRLAVAREDTGWGDFERVPLLRSATQLLKARQCLSYHKERTRAR